MVQYLLLVFLSFSVYSESLKLCYDQYPPSTIIPNSLSGKRGYTIDMMEEIYRSKGYSIDFITVPLARGLLMIQKGNCDIYAEYPYSKYIEKEFIFPKEKTFSHKLLFFVRKDSNWNFTDIDSLKTIRVATGIGWDYSNVSKEYQDYLLDPKNKNRVESLTGDVDVVQRILKLISSGRIDTYCDSSDVIQYYLKELKIEDQFRTAGGFNTLLIEKPIFSPKLPEQKRIQLMNIWDTERAMYFKSGKDKKFKKEYGL